MLYEQTAPVEFQLYTVSVHNKGVTGLLGGHKRRLGVWGPQRGPGAEPR